MRVWGGKRERMKGDDEGTDRGQTPPLQDVGEHSTGSMSLITPGQSCWRLLWSVLLLRSSSPALRQIFYLSSCRCRQESSFSSPLYSCIADVESKLFEPSICVATLFPQSCDCVYVFVDVVVMYIIYVTVIVVCIMCTPCCLCVRLMHCSSVCVQYNVTITFFSLSLSHPSSSLSLFPHILYLSLNLHPP